MLSITLKEGGLCASLLIGMVLLMSPLHVRAETYFGTVEQVDEQERVIVLKTDIREKEGNQDPR